MEFIVELLVAICMSAMMGILEGAVAITGEFLITVLSIFLVISYTLYLVIDSIVKYLIKCVKTFVNKHKATLVSFTLDKIRASIQTGVKN